MVRRRVTVAGRVQGVWHREMCRRTAAAEGVAGWVRNNEDGTVEAVLEGDPAAVERMVAWMRKGPAQAVVIGVDVRSEDPSGETSFVVR